MLEFGLRAAGTGYPTSFLVDHPSKPGYVVDNYKFAWRFFPRSMARSPQPIVCSVEKPTDVVRILVFGGSAAMGDPEVAYGMPRVLQVLLESRFPQAKFEVINCAVTAINSHVVLPITRDCTKLQADAWIVYLGNNEVHGPFGAGTVFGAKNQSRWFLRSSLAFQETKLGQAAFAWKSKLGTSSAPAEWGGMEMFLEQKVPHDSAQLERVYAHFRKNLNDIVRSANPNTQVLVATVATNVRDFPPFISAHRADLSDNELLQWQEHFDAGCSAQDQGDVQLALSSFADAEKVDAHYAELEFRQAQCLLQVGEIAKAAEKGAAARDHDNLRFRCDSKMNDIIRGLSGENVEVVDAAQAMAKGSPGGMLGDDLLHEHVHLNFAGNYQLAKLFGDQLLAKLSLPNAEPGWASIAECQAKLGVSPFHERLTLQDVRGRLNAPPFAGQLKSAERDARIQGEIRRLTQQLTPEVGRETYARYQELLERNPNDWLLHQQFGLLKNSVGDQSGAAEHFRKVTELLPHRAEGFFRLGAQLNRLKDWTASEVSLRSSIRLRPDFVRAFNSLGICLSHQGRYAESYEQFAKAVELQPSFSEAYKNWGLVLENQKQPDQALEKYQLAVKANASDYSSVMKLGRSLLRHDDSNGAEKQFASAARLRPNSIDPHLELGLMMASKPEQHENARNHLQRVIELSPNHAGARQALHQLSN